MAGLDGSFGNGGVSYPDFFGRLDLATTVTTQPDGKILVGGMSFTFRGNENYSDAAICRLNKDGKFDPTYGQGATGKALMNMGGRFDPVTSNFYRKSDGKSWVVGTASGREDQDDSAMVALINQVGLKETLNSHSYSYGSNYCIAAVITASEGLVLLIRAEEYNYGIIYLDNRGKVESVKPVPPHNTGGWWNGLVLLPNDDVAVTGSNGNDPTIVIVRRNSDAEPVYTASAFSMPSGFKCGTYHASSRTIVCAGDSAPVDGRGDARTVVSRFHYDGQDLVPDTSFSADGKLEISVFAGVWESPYDVLVDNQGRVYLFIEGSGSDLITTGGCAVTRVTQTGLLDTSFNNNVGSPGTIKLPGWQTGAMFGSPSSPMSMDAQGRILCCGTKGSNFAVTRILV